MFCSIWFHKNILKNIYSVIYEKFYFISEIPVFPTVTAKITFQQFHWEDNISDTRFIIPNDYTEDPYRFPDLWHDLELSFIHILGSLRCLGNDPYNLDLPLVALDVPMTNLGNSSAEMTLIF